MSYLSSQEVAGMLSSAKDLLWPTSVAAPAGSLKAGDPRDPNEIADEWNGTIVPKGPADVTATQEFAIQILGSEPLYAIPTDTDTPRCVTAAFQAAADLWKLMQAKKRSVGFGHGTFSNLPSIFARRAAQPAKYRTKEEWEERRRQMHSDLRELQDFMCAAAELYQSDDGIIDADALHDLARELDGLMDSGYDFGVFEPGTVNVGLRLVYRQEWFPETYQVGELLHTLPMSPGEKVRYETRTWQTTKTTQEINESTTFSSEEILSTTKRDVKEVMDQSAKRWGLKQDMSGGCNFGIWHAEGSTSITVDRSSESRQAKQSFREAISKAAQSLRNERKVSISVSREQGSEARMTREIQNPNDEITVTYLFYELQRRYRIKEYLHDVVPVVYVAMDVPAASRIDVKWITKHDWILAGALLDKSFTEPLGFVTTEWPGLGDALKWALDGYKSARSVVDQLKGQITAIEEGLSGYNALNIAEVVEQVRLRVQLQSLGPKLKAALDAEAAARQELHVAELAYRRGQEKVDRLLVHIRQNVLHYMQAIWAAEVPEQRYLRMRSIMYPHVVWRNGAFIIDRWMPLAEVVDTEKHLGYIGNYAIYRLVRNDNAIVNMLGEPFFDGQGVRDPDNSIREDLQIYCPTDAVYLEALPGTHSLLETFKLQHRKIDVEKARQDVLEQLLKSVRRLLLVNEGRLGDPEVEKLVVAESALVQRALDAAGETAPRSGSGDL